MEAVVLAAVLTMSLAIAVLAARTSLSLAMVAIDRITTWTSVPPVAPVAAVVPGRAVVEERAAPAGHAMAA